VLQTVIQFGTAIYGKVFSGGASNRFQKLIHVQESLIRPVLKSGCSSLRILANLAAHSRVAAVTQQASCSNQERFAKIGFPRGLPLLIRAVKETCCRDLRERSCRRALALNWVDWRMSRRRAGSFVPCKTLWPEQGFDYRGELHPRKGVQDESADSCLRVVCCSDCRNGSAGCGPVEPLRGDVKATSGRPDHYQQYA
jgi:hypothetical protein